MSSQPVSRAGAVPRRLRRGPPLALAVLVLAGCRAGGIPGTGATTGPDAGSPAVSPAAAGTPLGGGSGSSGPTEPSGTTDPSPTPPPAAASPGSPLPAAPPAATLATPGDTPVEGALGSYTWGDEGSDAPWIVVRADRSVPIAGPCAVAFQPSVPVGSWTAAWAPIVDGAPGPVAGSAGGSGEAVAFAGPAGGGAWTLKLDVAFAAGGEATYYWRLQASR